MPLPAESPPPRRTRAQMGCEGFRRWLACEESGLLSPPPALLIPQDRAVAGGDAQPPACPMLQARRDSRTPRPVESSGCPVPVPAAHWDFFASRKVVMGEDLCSLAAAPACRHAPFLCALLG